MMPAVIYSSRHLPAHLQELKKKSWGKRPRTLPHILKTEPQQTKYYTPKLPFYTEYKWKSLRT
jgi:hypothetical protein